MEVLQGTLSDASGEMYTVAKEDSEMKDRQSATVGCAKTPTTLKRNTERMNNKTRQARGEMGRIVKYEKGLKSSVGARSVRTTGQHTVFVYWDTKFC